MEEEPQPAPEPIAEEPIAEEPAAEEESEEQWEDLPWQMPASEDAPQPELEATRRMDAVQLSKPEQMGGDTVRLEGLRGELADRVHTHEIPEDSEEAKVWKPEETIHAEPFSDQWEPDYEEPIGEYIPPQPIVFQPRSRMRELKRKLIAGPEKRFYELTEKGVGKTCVIHIRKMDAQKLPSHFHHQLHAGKLSDQGRRAGEDGIQFHRGCGDQFFCGEIVFGNTEALCYKIL